MNEEQYQKSKFIDKYRKDIPVKNLKLIFNRAWGSSMRLGNILSIAENMVYAYKLNKN